METYSSEARLQDVTLLQREQLNDNTNMKGNISCCRCSSPSLTVYMCFCVLAGWQQAFSSVSPAHGCIILHLQRSQKVKGGKTPRRVAPQCLTTPRWSQSSSLIDPQTAPAPPVCLQHWKTQRQMFSDIDFVLSIILQTNTSDNDNSLWGLPVHNW